MRLCKKWSISPYYRAINYEIYYNLAYIELNLNVAYGNQKKTKESDEARTKKRKLNRVAETREYWAKMEESGESFESWQQRGFKTPTKPKKPKPKAKPKKEVKKKAAKKNESRRSVLGPSDLQRNEDQGKVRSSSVVKSLLIFSKLFNKIEIQ